MGSGITTSSRIRSGWRWPVVAWRHRPSPHSARRCRAKLRTNRDVGFVVVHEQDARAAVCPAGLPHGAGFRPSGRDRLSNRPASGTALRRRRRSVRWSCTRTVLYAARWNRSYLLLLTVPHECPMLTAIHPALFSRYPVLSSRPSLTSASGMGSFNGRRLLRSTSISRSGSPLPWGWRSRRRSQEAHRP